MIAACLLTTLGLFTAGVLGRLWIFIMRIPEASRKHAIGSFAIRLGVAAAWGAHGSIAYTDRREEYVSQLNDIDDPWLRLYTAVGLFVIATPIFIIRTFARALLSERMWASFTGVRRAYTMVLAFAWIQIFQGLVTSWPADPYSIDSEYKYELYRPVLGFGQLAFILLLVLGILGGLLAVLVVGEHHPLFFAWSLLINLLDFGLGAYKAIAVYHPSFLQFSHTLLIATAELPPWLLLVALVPTFWWRSRLWNKARAYIGVPIRRREVTQ